MPIFFSFIIAGTLCVHKLVSEMFVVVCLIQYIILYLGVMLILLLINKRANANDRPEHSLCIVYHLHLLIV